VKKRGMLGIMFLILMIGIACGKKISTEEIKYNTENIEVISKNINIDDIDYKYPQVAGYKDKEKETLFNEQISHKFMVLQNKIGETEAFNFEGKYKILERGDKFLSIRIETYAENNITGEKFKRIEGLNIDLEKMKILVLGDIFSSKDLYEKEIDNTLREFIRKQNKLNIIESMDIENAKKSFGLEESFSYSNGKLILYYNTKELAKYEDPLVIEVNNKKILKNIKEKFNSGK